MTSCRAATATTTCKAIPGDDVMEGGDGDDTFYDLRGANIARGGAGNDTIEHLVGTIEGGTGNDTLTGTGWLRTPTCSASAMARTRSTKIGYSSQSGHARASVRGSRLQT